MPRGRGGGRGGKPSPRPTIVAPRTLPVSLLPPLTEDSIPPVVVESLPEFHSLQPFFPTQERLRSTPLRTPLRGWMGSSITSLTRDSSNSLFASLRSNDVDYPVFLKRIHLLDPLCAVEGDYQWLHSSGLSVPTEQANAMHKKLQEPLNEAYVDSLFALCANQLVSTNTSPHWCRCFGTMSGRVNKYLYNITEEVAEFERTSWWKPHQRMGLFRVVREDGEEELLTGSSAVEGSKQIVSDALSLSDEDFEDVSAISSDSEHVLTVEEPAEPSLKEGGDAVALRAPRVQLRRLEDEDSDSSTNSSDGPQTFAEFPDFPVQVTLLERADGTMDDLLEAEEESEEKWTAWLFQVVAALTCAQSFYGFVHNDLHTNNIMWSSTTLTHLYYRIGTSYRKVPTFGKIMKIIDFGRASFTLPEAQGGFYISDAFFEGNDAADQYNCAPFYNPLNGPNVEPNPSFDLCRLSVSLIESLYPTRPASVTPLKTLSKEGGKVYSETVSPLYNLLWKWLLDKQGKNVLRSPDGHERYPDFDLYKAIGSDVKGAVPSEQVDAPAFASFRTTELPPSGVQVYDLSI